jgi:hypothetical protein
VGLRKGGLDVRYNAFEIRHHISIGKSQDLIAMRGAIFRAPHVIVRLVIVACAVEFDDEVQFPAQEVGEVRADGHLAAELVADFLAAKLLP